MEQQICSHMDMITKTFNITTITYYTEKYIFGGLEKQSINCYKKHTLVSAKRYLNKLGIKYYPEITITSHQATYTMPIKKFLEVATLVE